MRLLLLIALASASACISPTCKTHCDDYIELDIHVDNPESSIGSVQMCLNGACAQGALVAGSDDVALSGAFDAQARASSDATGTSLALSISGGNGAHHDGDVYRVSVLSTTGVSLFDAMKTVTYQVHDSSCSDGGCRVLTTTLP